MPTRLFQSSFAAGEFSPLARDRSDLQAYFQGADLLENLVILVEGPARRRAGSRFVAEIKNSADGATLIDFVKSSADSVVIEAGANYFRYFNGDTMAPQMDGGSPYETATPYSAAAAARLYWSQSADVMFLTDLDGALAPRALRRFAGDAWSLVAYAVKFGPFLPRSQAYTLTPSNVQGSVTVTSNGPVFNAGHVGARLRLFEPNLGAPYDKWMPEAAVVANDQREYAGNVYQALNSDTTSNQPPVHDNGTVQDRAVPPNVNVVNWTYLHDLSGSGVITAYVSATQVTMTVEERLPKSTATSYWAESAFSDFRGWPRLVGIYEQRLFFVSTKSQPDTIFLSRTEGFNESEADFRQSKGNDTVEDDHAIVRTLSDNEVNAPAWAIAFEQLILGTPKGLIRIAGPSLDEAITPAGASARRIPTTRPAGKDARPVIAGDALLYVGVGGRQIHEYAPEAAARALTVRASHVAAAGIVEMAWCGEPYQRLYARDAAGRLFVCAYDRGEGVVAWSRHVPGGAYLGGPALVDRIVSVRDGQMRARLVMIVRRTINGATRRFIERLEDDWTAERNLADDANFMDAALRFDFFDASGASVTITAAADAERGASVTIAASSGTPFTGKALATLVVRKVSAPPRADDAPGEMRVRIDTVTGGGSSATGTLLTSPDPDRRLVNAALTQWGFASASITGLSHLEGQTVAVQADGMDAGRYVVAAGAITLDESVMRGFVGLETSWRGRSLPLAREIEEGSSRGRRLAIEAAFASLFETGPLAAAVRVIEDGEAREGFALGGRLAEDAQGAPPAIRSFAENIGAVNFSGEEVQLEIYGAGVFPATVRSIGIAYSNET